MSAVLMSIFNTLHGIGQWTQDHAENMLDSGAHYYDVYETKDGQYISIGSIEPQFYKLLIEKAELDPEAFRGQNNKKKWPEMKAQIEAVFLTKTRDEWCAIMEGTDVCFAPVLDFVEAQQHPHNVARETYIQLDGITQPAPAPRFSRTPSEIRAGSQASGADTEQVFKDWGIE